MCALSAGGIACAGGGDELGSARSAAIAVPGPWVIPDDVLAAGDAQYVDFTGAGPWRGEEGCGGGLLEGTGILRAYIREHFPQAWEIGGYNCRPIVGDPGSMSVHATGRALDVMIYPVGHPDGSEADNEMGDPIGNWLIVNAERIGIQQIIWDRWLWRGEDAPGQKDRPYTGEHPHNDHLHIELSVAAGEDLAAPFFQQPQGPPELPSCGTLPAEGGVIDDLHRCADFFGPPEFWRAVDGAGEGGNLLWTDQFQAAEPSNWARWSLDFAEAGRYRVEFHAVAEYAVAQEVRYEIQHGGGVETISIDQGDADGWVALGEYDFAAGGYQHVALFDNLEEPVAGGQHIVFDALRVRPCQGGACSGGSGTDPDPDPGHPGDPDPDPGPDPETGPGDGSDGASALGGGCAAAGGRPGTGAAATCLLLLVAMAARARRRR